MNLPSILSSRAEGDRAIFELSIPGDLEAFRGHFPDRPILPGVVQIDWAVRLAPQEWSLPAVARDFQVKFRNVISPGATLTLELRFDRAKRRLYFEYRAGALPMSSGRIALETAA
jgi:3-hydroxymyristoyl/3-hydroxydecanoyl-(acyl carrier protein) dehydratase